MLAGIIQRCVGLLFCGFAVAVLLAPALRVLAQRSDILLLEVSDRSALYLVDLQHALAVSLLEGRIEAAVFSPDGQTIAYLATDDNELLNLGLNLIDVDGRNPRVLIPAEPGLELQPPVWSPDGRELAFVARYVQDSFNNSLYVIDSDGQNLRRLTNSYNDHASPMWSPDGRKLLFTMNQGTGRLFNPNIYVIDMTCAQTLDACNAAIQPITRRLSVRLPRWSPDGQQIAFVGGGYNELYVVDADGQNIRRLASREGLLWFKWSPDSSSLVFAANQTMLSWRVAVVQVATGNIQVLESDRNAVAPVWSPDGEQIAFLGVDDRQFNIYVMDADGQNQRQVTGRETDGFRFDWSP